MLGADREITSREITGYDIIGDVHGCASALQKLLHKLGYRKQQGVYCYSEQDNDQLRKVIFLGDLIDRGKEIKETLALVKAMVDAQQAELVLGNHEISAIAYYTQLEDGRFLRPHTKRSYQQLAETLEQFDQEQDLLQMYLDWLVTMPLFIDKDDLRAVHACWEQPVIDDYVQCYQTNRLQQNLLKNMVDADSVVKKMIDSATRGLSLQLPDKQVMQGSDGYLRNSFRVKFWLEDAEVYNDIIFQPDPLPEALANTALSDDEKAKLICYDADEKPLFVGHYWLSGKPKRLTENIACLDYSAVTGGCLTAYRFNIGDKQLHNDQFVAVS